MFLAFVLAPPPSFGGMTPRAHGHFLVIFWFGGRVTISGEEKTSTTRLEKTVWSGVFPTIKQVWTPGVVGEMEKGIDIAFKQGTEDEGKIGNNKTSTLIFV